MPRIPSYPLIGQISNNDLMIIDDVSQQYATKSVELQSLKGYFNTGQATTTYVDDKVVSGAAFDTNTGILTLTRTDGVDVPQDLDGRYIQSLTTTGSSGAATLLNGVLNIPQYSSGGGGGGGSYTTLTRTISGNELVNAFNGTAGDEIILVTVPAGYQAVLLGDAIAYQNYNSGTTDYAGSNLNLQISTGISDISLFANLFTNPTYPFYITNGQTDINNALPTTNLGQNIILETSNALQRADFTAGDRDVILSFTYRLININL